MAITKYAIPADVIDWLRDQFKHCNETVSQKLSKIPTFHETLYDQSLIEFLSTVSAPRRLPSGWLVRIETHFLGGRSFFHNWEIADIGILITFRAGGRVIKTKLALLQSKKLYPNEQKLIRTQQLEHDLAIGFGRLLTPQAVFQNETAKRHFTLTKDSRYKSLRVGGQQDQRIAAYEGEFSIPVHYLFYNPLDLPWTVAFPVEAQTSSRHACKVGCRVIRATDVRALVKPKQKLTPKYSDLSTLANPQPSVTFNAGWSLEDFVVNLVIGCLEGHSYEGSGGELVRNVFYRRSYPISAAFSVSISSPE